MTYDVAVVGAGPAGSSAALALAEAGARVVLLEKQALPRYKTCGGGLVGRALALLPVSAQAAVEHHCGVANLNFPAARLAFTTRCDRPLFGMAMRATLDAALAGAAADAGTEVRAPCAVTGVELSAGGIILRTTCSAVATRFVVAADGATSPVARLAGWPETRHFAPALEAEIHVDATTQERLARAARFDFDVIPDGYGWVFPKREHLSVGVATMRRGGVNLHRCLDDYLRILGIERSAGDRHGWLIPFTPRRDTVARGRVLLTGDAAGLADPVTGEGITAALVSGRLGARAVLDEALTPGRVEARYCREVALTLMGELRVARWLGRILYQHPRLRTTLFRRHGDRLIRAMLEVAAGERGYVASVRNPLNYVRLFGTRRSAGSSGS